MAKESQYKLGDRVIIDGKDVGEARFNENTGKPLLPEKLPNVSGKTEQKLSTQSSLDTSLEALISASKPAVSRKDIERDVTSQYSGARKSLGANFDRKIGEFKEQSAGQESALEGKLGTRRRFSSSAEAFIKYVGDENNKTIANLEAQKEAALTNFDFELASLIDKRVEKEQQNAQQQFANLYTLIQYADKKQAEELAAQAPTIQASRENAVFSLVRQGIDDPIEIQNLLNFDEEGNQIGDFAIKDVTEILESVKTSKDEIEKVMIDVAKNGAPAEVKQAIAGANNLVDALEAAGDWLQTGSGDLGEALAIKRDMISRGLVPPSMSSLLTTVANQKAKATASTTGLPANVVSQIDKISSSFDSAPIVKQFNEVLNKKLGIEGIIESGVGGPADLALVFDFMKALDPTSVVRETEYANAAKSGNIFAGAFAKYNGYLKEKGGFLPENVKQGFKQLIDVKFGAVEKQYNNLKSEKARLINKKTGADDGADYLIDYSTNITSQLVEQEDTSKATVDSILERNPSQADQVANFLDQNMPYSQIVEWLNLRGIK